MQGAICMAKLKASGRAEVSEHQHRLEPGECKALLLKLEFMADLSLPHPLLLLWAASGKGFLCHFTHLE